MRCFVTALTLTLSACSAYPDLSDLSRPEIPFQASEISASSPLRVRALPGANAFEYDLSLRWELPRAPSDEASLYRVEGESRRLVAAVVDARGQAFEAARPAGARYRYEIVSSRGEVLATSEIAVPRDFVVRGEMRLPANHATIARLYFEPNAVLMTEGASLDWEIQELHSAPGARLVSFLPERAAAVGERARSSGGGRLRIRRLHEILLVQWRGETGAGGAHGLANPGRGGAGANARFFGVFSLASREPGGLDRNPCRARNGKSGEPGPQGGAGGPGENGGDTEELTIEVLSATPGSTVGLAIEAGRGGAGGEGGEGGRGGPGGRGSIGGVDCADGQDGAEGPRGPRGPRGQDGLSGAILGPLCLTEGAETRCVK
jgi:hypothetical protein